MKRALLTGASGFIGRAAIPCLLQRGFEVHAVFQRHRPPELDGVHSHSCNLLDPAAQDALLQAIRPTHLLHFAWEATPGVFWTSLENVRWVEASLHLLDGFRACGGQRAVLAGSCAEYDWTSGVCAEATTPTAPSTFYGVCKLSLQVLLDHYARQAHLSSAWGRIFFTYGPYEHPARLVAALIRGLLSGRAVETTAGTQVRDFLFVADVASAFAALLDSQVQGAVNIASGTPVFLRDVMDGLAQRIGRADLLHRGALLIPASEPPLLVAEVTRLTDEVGWQPRYALAEGLGLTVEWWRHELGEQTIVPSRLASMPAHGRGVQHSP